MNKFKKKSSGYLYAPWFWKTIGQ